MVDLGIQKVRGLVTHVDKQISTSKAINRFLLTQPQKPKPMPRSLAYIGPNLRAALCLSFVSAPL
jgi:hypothetical protein